MVTRTGNSERRQASAICCEESVIHEETCLSSYGSLNNGSPKRALVAEEHDRKLGRLCEVQYTLDAEFLQIAHTILTPIVAGGY